VKGRRLSLALLLTAILFVVGCDTMNWQQYRIAGVTAGSEDAVKLKSALLAIAEKTGLKDCSPDSRMPNTLFFYSQPEVRNFRVDLGARSYGDDVLIDLVGGFGPPPPAYKEAKSLLTPVLTAEFGSHLSVSQPFIPIQPTP
jgi:hypothetical protein